MAASLRLLFCALVACGLLVPKLTSVIAELVPGVQVMVICTGSEMKVITLDAEGTPIETSDLRGHACLTAEPEAPFELPEPPWHRLALGYTAPLPDPQDKRTDLAPALPPPSHGPPRLT